MSSDTPPTLLDTLRRDSERYADVGGWHRSRGFWLVAIYRFGRWAKDQKRPLRPLLWLLYRIAQLSYLLFNINLPAGANGARIGPGLCLIHPNNVYFGHGVEIGENCLIHHEVTLGKGPIPGTPRIGNNVTIFPGARIVGGINIGDDAMIGANCVVQRDVPAGTVLMMPAPRRIPRALSAWVRNRAPVIEPAAEAALAPDDEGSRLAIEALVPVTDDVAAAPVVVTSAVGEAASEVTPALTNRTTTVGHDLTPA